MVKPGVDIGWRGEPKREGGFAPSQIFTPSQTKDDSRKLIKLFERGIKGESIQNSPLL
jgi:hypothetical protein